MRLHSRYFHTPIWAHCALHSRSSVQRNQLSDFLRYFHPGIADEDENKDEDEDEDEASSSCQNQNPLPSCKAEGPRWCWRLQWSRKWDISPFVLIPTKDLCKPVTGTSEIRLGRNFSIDDKDMTDYYHHWQFPSNFFAKIFEFAFCGFYKVRAQKKITEFFPAWGGGVFPLPKTFVYLPSHFWYAKFILRC